MRITLDGAVYVKERGDPWRLALNGTWPGHEMCERLNDKAKERGEDAEPLEETAGFLES